MLAIDCPNHGAPVMVPVTRIRGLRNAPDGITLHVECWCGARVAIRTGRRRAAPPRRPVYAGTGLSSRSDAPAAP
jgi:hypothetical protein